MSIVPAYSIALLNMLLYIPAMALTNWVRKTLRSIIKQRQILVLLYFNLHFPRGLLDN